MKKFKLVKILTPFSLAFLSLGLFSNYASAVTFHNSDGSIIGSLCVGFDCSSSESFGFDTLRLKENNLRIHFNDTSTSASFAGNDWRIVANDSSNGGANYLAIEDTTAGRIPFRVEAGAIANALYVDSDGDVGVGTSNPVVEVHAVDGNTPTVRLEQDGSNGFTAQTWDMAGNETNFFIRDVTNGSLLPFRIRPSAPTDSLFVAADGDIGMGTDSPDVALDISRTGTSAQLQFEDRTAGHKWVVGQSASNTFSIKDPDSSVQFRLFKNGNFILTNSGGTNTFTVNAAGNLVIPGMLSQGSDINSKEDIHEVDTSSVLARISKLAIATWKYKTDDKDHRHMGPMAQDFYKKFSLGEDDRHIATLDTSGVALAGIQELIKQSSEKDKTIQSLQDKVTKLEILVKEIVGLNKAKENINQTNSD